MICRKARSACRFPSVNFVMVALSLKSISTVHGSPCCHCDQKICIISKHETISSATAPLSILALNSARFFFLIASSHLFWSISTAYFLYITLILWNAVLIFFLSVIHRERRESWIKCFAAESMALWFLKVQICGTSALSDVFWSFGSSDRLKIWIILLLTVSIRTGRASLEYPRFSGEEAFQWWLHISSIKLWYHRMPKKSKIPPISREDFPTT